MPDSPNILNYEARGPNALQGGERVLWEQPANSRPPSIYRLTNHRVMQVWSSAKKRPNIANLESLHRFEIRESNWHTGTCTLRFGLGDLRFEKIESATDPAAFLLR